MVFLWFRHSNGCVVQQLATGFSAGIALGVGLGLSAGLAAIFIATGEEGALPPVDHLKNIYIYTYNMI